MSDLPNNCIYIKNFMGKSLFNQLDNEISFYNVYRMGYVCSSVMSNQCDFSDELGYPIYRHPIDTEPKVFNWTKTVSEIKNKISEMYPDLNLNHCLIRKYPNGKSFLREHSDKTIDILDNSFIFNYSSGTTRTFVLKHKVSRKNIKIQLEDDSLFIMDLKTNDEYFHCIKEQASISEPRISLTFRTIASYKKNNIITGKGSKFQNFLNDELIQIYKLTNKRDENK